MSAGDVGAVVAGLLMLLGALFFLVTALGMLRSRDAISRVNNLSPATGAGLPLVIIGAAVHDLSAGDLTVLDGVKAALAVGAALVVSSVASNMLGRAAYRSQTELDPRTVGNALEPFEELEGHEHED
ncbi:monovalent cation/H(+) antiporter subunit G [Nocardioides sp. SOB44]|jgi:multicomponent Na+:H+ antiporter subunit G|uniref:Monovalent cation/H(+) antiporter subunit G n=1 Tax=Nocardioides cremeus TaxID=3058044 RepID=A0ABT8TQR7_9ACTN|nr:monovalent cation/H(+) antiporter subunit G [Nocardioides cremeus]MDO3394637.1 monovalent cation/H(+) antiporter subunit G [Nocardioides cremeus]